MIRHLPQLPPAVIACDDCVPGISNDDWSHLDHAYGAVDAPYVMAYITGQLEIFGHLTPIQPANEPGYFECDICSEIQCGGGKLYFANGV